MWSNEPSWDFTTSRAALVLSFALLLNALASFLFLRNKLPPQHSPRGENNKWKRMQKKKSKKRQMFVGWFWQMYYFPCIMLSTVQHISELLRYGGIVCSRKYFLSMLHGLYYIKLLVFKGMNGNAYSAWRWYTYNHSSLFSPEQKTSITRPRSATAERGQSQLPTTAPGPGARSVPWLASHW